MSEKEHRAFRDPTADIAISHVMREEKRRFRKRVFICSFFAGAVEENIAAAKNYCLFAIHNGAAPFAPHLLYPQFLKDGIPRQRDEALRCGAAFLGACNEVWIFGNYMSSGMANEIQLAQKLNKPIRYFDNNCREVKTNAEAAEHSR